MYKIIIDNLLTVIIYISYIIKCDKYFIHFIIARYPEKHLQERGVAPKNSIKSKEN